jgi:hypothetical protein
MWGKIAKWSIKIIVALGLHTKAKDWIAKKLDGKEEKITKKFDQAVAVINEARELNQTPKPAPEGQEYARTGR